MIAPLNLQQWIDDHRAHLKPPVGNKVIFPERDFIVMVVAGPNVRYDYHVDPREELFFQVEGAIQLHVIEDNKPRVITIAQGEMLLLPAWVPHKPVRPAHTIGLVVEHQRAKEELDAFQWYCDQCHALLYENHFHLDNLETACKAALDGALQQAIKYSTCRFCGYQHNWEGVVDVSESV